MITFPFRLIYFLVALVALGVYAAAVTLPHTFQAGDPIRADEVNANFATLANAVESRAAPSELIVTVGNNLGTYELEVDFFDVAEMVVTSTPGRWMISKFVHIGLDCSAASSLTQLYLTVNGTPVRASTFSPEQGRTAVMLTGLTEEVLPAGTHAVQVFGDCIGSDWTSAGGYDRTISSVIVFPEAP
jgi:hypothetical protein